jgi:hypothetical protein
MAAVVVVVVVVGFMIGNDGVLFVRQSETYF